MSELRCGVCIYVEPGLAPKAVTVIEGYAVCDDHLGLVAQGMRFAAMLEHAIEQREARKRLEEAP